MNEFTLHSQETAPGDAKPLLENSMKRMGFIPNLHAVIAKPPVILEPYQKVIDASSKAGLTPTERQVVYQVNNFDAGCTYCVVAHSMISDMEKVPAEITEALRAGTLLPDEKLEVLAQFSRKIRSSFGYASEADGEAFYKAGYSKTNVLDVIVITATKVLSNYTNHIAETPLDKAFEAYIWEKPMVTAAEKTW